MSEDHWAQYSNEERESILKTLPSKRQSHTTDHSAGLNEPPLPFKFINSDPYFKRALARFTHDVELGYYEKTWQVKARKAQNDRYHGQFDTFLQEHAQDAFSVDATDLRESRTTTPESNESQ